MRKTFPLLAAIAVVGIFATGCANTEKKFGRGVSNTFEIVRLGELRRSNEQASLFSNGNGFFTGLNRTFARTGVGIYEMVTAPFPPYDPPFPDYLAPGPVYPDSYKPSLVSESTFATDANLGFSGGDVAPFLPGSRFRIFDTH